MDFKSPGLIQGEQKTKAMSSVSQGMRSIPVTTATKVLLISKNNFKSLRGLDE